MVLQHLATRTPTLFVDRKEKRALPRPLFDALQTMGGTQPFVLFIHPISGELITAFSHAQLADRQFEKTFAPVWQHHFAAPLRRLPPTDLLDWTSAQGTTLTARLIGVEEGGSEPIYLFQTAQGQERRAPASQLSADSRDRATKWAASKP